MKRTEIKKEQEVETRLHQYHKRVLNSDITSDPVLLPPIRSSSKGLRTVKINQVEKLKEELEGEGEEKRDVDETDAIDHNLITILNGGDVRGTNVVGSPLNTGGKLLSMSTRLGAKAKEFGKVVPKKRKLKNYK